jgi:hypothetical protein
MVMFETFSDNLKKKIQSSPEWEKLSKKTKTVDDIAFQRTALRDMANSTVPGERRMAAILGDKLSAWEESAILRHVKNLKAGLEADPEKYANFADKINRIDSLLPKMQAAKEAYAPFIQDVAELSSRLGKERIHMKI